MRSRPNLLLASALLTLNCVARQDAPNAAAPDTLTLAVRADVTGFFPNPPIESEAFTIDVNRSLFETLVRFDSGFRLEPGLAERWESPDDRTFVFQIRPGLRFSDGTPLTARDVAASLNATRERGWVLSEYLRAVESVEAIDDRHVRLRTHHPSLVLLAKLTWGFILPAEALSQTPVPALGTGPYRLQSWTPGKEFVLLRNAHFRGPAPAFSRVRFRIEPDAGKRLDLVLRGEADVADQVPLDALDSLQAHGDVRVVTQPSLRVLFLCLRVDQAPFSDPLVREAVDLALDRSELIAQAVNGRAEPASQLVPAAVVGFNPSLALARPDRARARRLLARAGYGRGLRVRLDGPNNRYVNDVRILQEIARQLSLVGIQTTVNALDKREFFPLIEASRSKLHLLGFACESGESGDVLDSLVHSPQPGPYLNLNSVGLADPELDRLIDEANASTSDRQRVLLLQAAMARTGELRATLPLLIQTEAVVLTRRVAWDPPLTLALRPEAMRPSR